MVKRKQIQNFSTFIENSKIFEVLNRLEAEGFEAYLAGGAVRDMLLGKQPHDFDVTTDARPKDVKRLFPKYLTRGERFGTITVILVNNSDQSSTMNSSTDSEINSLETTETFEVTTYRSEDVYTDSRHPDLIKFSDSLFEDSKRRDFTINGLYADKEGRLLDPQDGLNDLELKLIRTIGNPDERFSEDALRVLRALRFSSQLGFEIQDNTLKSALEHWSSLSKVSAERVFEELKKMILGVNFLKVLPLILEHKLFDQFVENKSLDSNPGVYNYLSQRLNAYKDSNFKFENFLLDYSLVATDKYESYLKECIRVFPFKKSERNRVEEASYLLKILSSKETVFSAGKIIALGLKIWPVQDLKVFLSHELFDVLNLDLVNQEVLLKTLNSLEQVPIPKVKAQHLMSRGLKPGPGLRLKLDFAYELQLENPGLSVSQLIEKIIS